MASIGHRSLPTQLSDRRRAETWIGHIKTSRAAVAALRTSQAFAVPGPASQTKQLLRQLRSNLEGQIRNVVKRFDEGRIAAPAA